MHALLYKLSTMGKGSRAKSENWCTLKAVLIIASTLSVLVLAAALRVLALDADPPPSMSPDFVSDEAWWAHNARNRALFGKWVLDDFNQGIFAAPVHTALARLSFAAGGVSLKQTRLVSALSGLGTIGLAGLMLWRALGFWSGMAGMVILTFDYLMLSYDRTGFVEPVPALLMTLAATLTLGPREHLISLFLAGVVAVLALFAKANAVFFVPVPIVFLLVRRTTTRIDGEGRRALFRKLSAYVLGSSLCFAVWFFAFIRPNWDDFVMQNNRLRSESRVSGIHILFNFFSIGLMGTKEGVRCSSILTASFLPVSLACVWTLHNGIMVWRRGLGAWAARLLDLELFGLVWLVVLFPYFVLNNNGADRRYYVFLIPLTVLGVHALVPRRRELMRFNARRRLRWAIPSTVAGLVLSTIPPILYLRPPIVNVLQGLTKDITIGKTPGLSMQALAMIATVILLICFLSTAPLVVRALRGIRFRVGLIAALLVLILLPLQLYRVGLDATRLSFTLAQAGAKAQSLIGDDARVVDGSGLIMGTRSRNLILLDRRWVGPGYPFFGRALIPSFRPTHLTVSGACTESEFAKATLERLDGWGRYVPGTLQLYPFCLDDQGATRFVSSIGKVEPVEGQ